MPHPAMRRTPLRPTFDHGAPISAIDTRPMMFVALFVALIFLLAASQTRTHALLVDLPLHFRDLPPAVGPAPVIHRIAVTENDMLLLNGKRVTPAKMIGILKAARQGPRELRIAFEPDANASYEKSVQTLAVLQRSGFVSSLFCLDGLEKHRHFSTEQPAPFPLMLTLAIETPPQAQGIEPQENFDSCAPEQLISNAWMF